MSSSAKRRPYVFPKDENASTREESLRESKKRVEELRQSLQKKILENPRLAKKSAVVLSGWIQGKEKKIARSR